MKIELEEKAKLIALGLGYYQIVDGELFEPAAIGFTNERIVIYSDYEPDEIQVSAVAYSIKKVIPLNDIKTVVIERLKKDADLKRFYRFNFILKNTEDSTCFYYDKADAKFMKRFIGALKYAEIRVVKHNIDLRPIA